jgi:hypothetical protein
MTSKITRGLVIGVAILLLAILAEVVCRNGMSPALATVFGLTTVGAFAEQYFVPAQPKALSTELIDTKLDAQSNAIALVQQTLSFIIQKTKIDQMP